MKSTRTTKEEPTGTAENGVSVGVQLVSCKRGLKRNEDPVYLLYAIYLLVLRNLNVVVIYSTNH